MREIFHRHDAKFDHIFVVSHVILSLHSDFRQQNCNSGFQAPFIAIIPFCFRSGKPFLNFDYLLLLF